MWIYNLAGTSAPSRRTFEGKNRFPIWSPDGQRIAFQSDREGDPAIFAQRADGTGPIERLTKPATGESHVPESWSPDGRHLSFSVTKGATISLWMLSLDDKKASPYGNVQSSEPIESVFSPDGRWIAYTSTPLASVGASPNRGVFLQPFPATGDRYQVPKQQIDFHPVWSRTGTELFFVPTTTSGRLAAVHVTTQPTVTFGPTESLLGRVTGGRLSLEKRAHDILPDGRFIGLVTPGQDSSLSAASVSELRVIVNWFEELKQRVPTK